MVEHRSKGHVQFDDMVDDEFRDRVRDAIDDTDGISAGVTDAAVDDRTEQIIIVYEETEADTDQTDDALQAVEENAPSEGWLEQVAASSPTVVHRDGRWFRVSVEEVDLDE